MKDRLLWEFYDKYNYILRYVRYRKNQVANVVLGHSYYTVPHMVAGKWLISQPKTNQIIAEAIRKGESFWAGRFGDTELNAVYSFLLYRMNNRKDIREEAMTRLCHNAGFFPNSIQYGEKFTDLMIQDCAQIDLLGEWHRYMEDYIYVKYQKPHTQLTRRACLEPWNMYQYPKSQIKPWSASLKGKKVLVIHPFEDSIKKQYTENREHIFERIFDADDILPEFELITLKAVQTMAGEQDTRFSTWFDALEWMIQRCQETDFDVAIIGCGAYGFPLAAEIKRMGKIAIHLGGSTQILFGITGHRWETEYRDFFEKVSNDFWVRPMEEERIKNADSVESACYW